MKKRSPISLMIPAYFVVLICFILSGIYGSQAVTAYSEKVVFDNRTCVIIDAGHGGEDGGAISCSGIKESNFNLEISKRINDLLNLIGVRTYMIRCEDISIYKEGSHTIAAKKVSDLKERVRIINQTENAVLISVHQNYFHDSKYSGTQVFYANTNNSEQLAKNLQQNFKTALQPNNKRQAKKTSGIYLMEHITCPGVLIECGFLSNPKEEAYLRDAEYQKDITAVISCTLSNYLDRQ